MAGHSGLPVLGDGELGSGVVGSSVLLSRLVGDSRTYEETCYHSGLMPGLWLWGSVLPQAHLYETAGMEYHTKVGRRGLCRAVPSLRETECLWDRAKGGTVSLEKRVAIL